MSYSNFASNERIIRELNKSMKNVNNGILAATIDGKNYYYGKKANILISGQTGSGKTESCALTYNRAWIEAGDTDILCIDSKGEEARKLIPYAKENGYNIKVLNFRNLKQSDLWNPLSLPYALYKNGDKDHSCLLIKELADSIYKEKAQDPFWSDSAKRLFMAGTLILFEYGKQEEINITSLVNIINEGSDRRKFPGKTALKILVENISKNNPIRFELLQFVDTANDTAAGMLSEFNNGISIFSECEELIKITSANHCDIDIYNYDNNKKNAFFVILPGITSSYNALAGTFVSQILKYITVIADNSESHSLKRQFVATLEELGSVGTAIPDLPKILSECRARNIRCISMVQSLAQLKYSFGEEGQNTIIGNSSMIITFRSNDWDTLTYISQLAGAKEINYQAYRTTMPVISQTNISELKTGQAIIFLDGLKYTTRFPMYSDLYESNKNCCFVEHEHNEEINIFDISELVKKISDTKNTTNDFNYNMTNPFRNIPNPYISLSEDEIDREIASIERKLKELDEEEKREKQKLNKSRNLVDKYILNISGQYDSKKIIEILSKVTSLSKETIKLAIDTYQKCQMPLRIPCDSKREAESARNELILIKGLQVSITKEAVYELDHDVIIEDLLEEDIT